MGQIVRAPYFGQVEPNHLSAQRNGQIYAQLPVSNKKTDGVNFDINVLENGQFVKYDYENQKYIICITINEIQNNIGTIGKDINLFLPLK